MQTETSGASRHNCNLPLEGEDGREVGELDVDFGHDDWFGVGIGGLPGSMLRGGVDWNQGQSSEHTDCAQKYFKAPESLIYIFVKDAVANRGVTKDF